MRIPHQPPAAVMTLVELVERERARLLRLELAAGIALGVAVAGVVAAVGVLVLGGARWLSLPRILPFVVWAVLLLSVAVLAWNTARRLRARASRAAVAAAIEAEQALRAGALRGALEIAGSGALGRRAAEQMTQHLASPGRALAPLARRQVQRRAAQAGVVAVIAVLLLGAVAPVASDGLLALLRPVRAWRGTLLAPLAFERLPLAVQRGDTLRVVVAAHGRVTVQLRTRTTGEGWAVQELPVDRASGTASATVGPLRGDLTVLADDGRSSTDSAVVRVTDRPFVGAVTMRAVYPAYLGRPAETLPTGEPAAIPRGTVLEITGRASTVLTSVGLVNGRDSVALVPDGQSFRGRFMPAVAGTWRWHARGVTLPVSDVPDPLEITVVPDSAPRVELQSPVADTAVAATDRVTLQAAATDDHGLASVDVQSWIGAGRAAAAVVTQRVAVNAGPVWSGGVTLDLAARGLKPGDALHVKFVATDNSPWAQRGESRELVLQVPDMQERRAIARAAGDSAVRAVQAAAQAAQAMQQRTDEMAREQANRAATAQADNPAAAPGRQAQDKPLAYDAAQRAKDVVKDQQAMADRIGKLQQAASQLQEQLRQAGALDSSLARQMREVQQMLRDALTPDLLAQMRKLEAAASQLSADQAQASLRDLAALQQQMRERLEKSAQMLQRAAFEGAMQTLHDEASDIARQEHALADSSGQRAGTTDSAASTGQGASAGPRDRTRELADRSARLRDAMQQLAQRLSNANAATGAQRTDSASRHADASASQMRQDRDPSAAASQMDQAARAMQQARDQQVGEWKQELTTELDRAVQELLQMSRQESAMEQQSRGGQVAPDQLRGAQSAVQQGVEQTQRRLQEQAQKTTLLSGRAQRAMADAAQKVAQATQSAADPRNASATPGAMGEAADALNRAAAALARDREHANAASSASGFEEMLQQMQEMAKRQGSINSQAQGLMPLPGASPSLGADAQATARMLARQERALAQQLDDLSDAPGTERAAQLAREARAVADALDTGRLDAGTVARQEQLLRHMLDAGRTLQKDDREDTGKREAESAVNPQVFTPQGGQATGRSADRFRPPAWDELRGLSADERRAILEYFRRINAQRP